LKTVRKIGEKFGNFAKFSRKLNFINNNYISVLNFPPLTKYLTIFKLGRTDKKFKYVIKSIKENYEILSGNHGKVMEF